MSQSRKHRGYKSERSVAEYLSQWWPGASVQRGNGKDIINVPYDCEVKSRSQFSPMEWLRQAAKRSKGKEPYFVVARMNGQGDSQEAVPEYLAFMRFGDLVQLLLQAGYGDIQQDSVQLEPERCVICGSWKLKDVPCRTCKVSNANL
jgi:hypothetical protein